jgi:hypothetical protein
VQSDGHDAPRLVDERVPCLAAAVDDVIVGFADAVGEPAAAHALAGVLDRVELETSRRQGLLKKSRSKNWKDIYVVPRAPRLSGPAIQQAGPHLD